MTGRPEHWICVVDDDDDLRATLRRVLEEAGLHVADFSRGDDALKFAESPRASLYLVDIVMPDQEGLEVVRSLRALDERAPIIAMTGYDSRYLEIAQMFGADDVLRKPFTGRQLLACVRRLLDRGEAPR